MAVVKKILGNIKGPQGDRGVQGPQGEAGSTGIRGSRWVNGNAITGNSTTPTSYSTGISDALVNDQYLNIKTGNVYRCMKAGDQNTAQWVFEGNISNNTLMVPNGEYDADTYENEPIHINNLLYIEEYNMYYAVAGSPSHMYESSETPSSFYIGSSYGLNENVTITGMTYDKDNDILLLVGKDIYNGSNEAFSSTSLNSLENHSLSAGGDIRDVYYANNRFVAVGDSGHITLASSHDIGTWDRINIDTIGNVNLKKVIYGNDSWVALGDTKIIYTKNELATDWAESNINNQGTSVNIANFKDITFGNGIFVAVGDSFNVIYSKNASDWKNSQVIGVEGFEETEQITNVVYVFGKFVACTASGLFIECSDNGLFDWKRVNLTDENIDTNGYRVNRLFNLDGKLTVVSENSTSSIIRIFDEGYDILNLTDVALMLYKDYLSRT